MKTAKVRTRIISTKNWPQLLRVIVISAIIFIAPVTHVHMANGSYVYDRLNRLFQASNDEGKTITYIYHKTGNRRVKETVQLQETLSLPSKPIGPTDGIAEGSYVYSARRSTSNLGHPVQYLFDWGDETNSGWLPAGQTSASKSWVESGTYDVKVRARCATHNLILSEWSDPISVDIVPIEIDLQFPPNEAVFSCCSLITHYQPSFGWAANGIFAQYTILLSTSPEDFTTKEVLIAKATLPGTASSWIPIAPFWKTILVSSHNKGEIREIYWKVIGTRADKKTVESEVRSFAIEDPQKVTLLAPLNNATLVSGLLPGFEFNSNCNIRFTLEISSLGDFSVPTKVKSFAYTIKDPSIEAVVKRSLTSVQWTSVKQLVEKEKGYFRIRAWDGLNRETISEVRSFKIQQ